MKKFIIWMEDLDKFNKLSDLEEYGNNTDFEYNIGETIRVNSDERNIYKCMKKEVVNGKLYQYFKKGRISYNFDY